MILFFNKTENKIPPFKFSNLKAQYYKNNKYKNILAVKGFIVNYRDSQYSHIRLKAVIFDKNRKKLAESISYAGNLFNKDKILNITPEYLKKFTLNNILLKNRQRLPFMIFFFNLPKSACCFQVIIEDYEKITK